MAWERISGRDPTVANPVAAVGLRRLLLGKAAGSGLCESSLLAPVGILS